MKDVAILLARSLAFIDLNQTDLKARVFWPDLIKELTREFSFQKPPQLSEWDESKGLEFKVGKVGNIVVDALKLFDTLVVVETHASTADSQKATDELFQWAKGKFGITYEPAMIRHWGFVNSISFASDVPILDTCSPPLSTLAHKISKALSDIWLEKIEYYPTILAVGHDPLARKDGIASFTIQRRAQKRFAENIYFSEAPLPTEVHIKLLEEFESQLPTFARERQDK